MYDLLAVPCRSAMRMPGSSNNRIIWEETKKALCTKSEQAPLIGLNVSRENIELEPTPPVIHRNLRSANSDIVRVTYSLQLARPRIKRQRCELRTIYCPRLDPKCRRSDSATRKIISGSCLRQLIGVFGFVEDYGLETFFM